MIRLAHVLDGRHFGGAEQMVRLHARAAPRHGIEAEVFCLGEGRLSQMLRDEGTAVEVIPSSGRLDFSPVKVIQELVRLRGIQVLQAHTSRTHLLSRLVTRRTGIPNITVIHSPIAQDENSGMGRHPLRAWVERLGRRWTQHICPVSREETERLIREEGVSPDRITCIPNGIEKTEPTYAPDPAIPFTIALVAALRPRKGPECLIRALGILKKEGIALHIRFIGDDEFASPDSPGRYIDSLRTLADDCGVGEQMEFVGFQSDPWKAAEGASIVALPSLFGEGLPLTLLEAMNHGYPILASDTLGNRECVIEGKTGWLVPPDNPESWAEKLHAILKIPDQLSPLGAEGRNYFLTNFELEYVMSNWLNLYKNLVGSVANRSSNNKYDQPRETNAQP